MTQDIHPAAALPNWRALCAELLDELSGYASANPYHDSDALVARARAALAQPELEAGPTFEQLYDLACEHDGEPVASMQAALARWGRAALARPEPEVAGPSDEELLRMAAEAIDPYDTIGIGEYEAETECAVELYGSELIAFARAVLARWGHQPAPALAEGEVAELVDRLRRASDGASAMGWEQDSWTIARAANLLEQRHPTPVPVSERLPGPEDCDAEGRCWWGFEETDDYEASWTLRKMIGFPFDDTHWLPATALPLPQGEVEA